MAIKIKSKSKIKIEKGTNSAFTLMEVMLALVVSAIVLAGIGSVFVLLGLSLAASASMVQMQKRKP